MSNMRRVYRVKGKVVKKLCIVNGSYVVYVLTETGSYVDVLAKLGELTHEYADARLQVTLYNDNEELVILTLISSNLGLNISVCEILAKHVLLPDALSDNVMITVSAIC